MRDSSPTIHWAPSRMAELLAAVTGRRTVAGALEVIVDRVAEAFDAEVTLLVGADTVHRGLGFGADSPPDGLLDPSDGELDLPGLGTCHVRSVPLDDEELDRLVVARTAGPYLEVETALLVGVARTIELSLRSVRSLVRERDLREVAAENARRKAELVADLEFRAAFDETLLAVARTLLTGAPELTDASLRSALARLGSFLGLEHARIHHGDDGPLEWEADGGAATATVRVQLPVRSGGGSLLELGLRGGESLDAEAMTLVEVATDLITNALDRRATHAALQRANQDLRGSNARLARANQELRRADRLKDEFVSMTSHELRTPLTAIQGFAETIAVRGDDLRPELVVELGDRIHEQATRLTRLVGDILDVSRLARGEGDVRPRPFDVRELVEGLRAEHWASQGDVELRGTRGRASADPDHVRRILLNLVENARKYGRPPIELEWSEDDDALVLRVTDHGTGVPEEFEPRLFERFQQASRGTRRSSSGTGLGLAIVRGLARMNDGEVGYRRAPHGGSTFWVRLPRAADREDAASAG